MEFRFVVLQHTGTGAPGGPHFDFLIEVHGLEKLMAWRAGLSPEEWAEIPHPEIGAVRIADHRKTYMTYEGEISGGRGEVRRIMAGAGKVLSATEISMAIELNKSPLIRIELPLR